MFSLSSKTCKYVFNLFIKNKSFIIVYPYFKSDKMTHKFFSEKIEIFEKEEIEEKLSEKIKKKDLKISHLTINILKYLENNYELYKRLCEDSIKLSYDLSESPDSDNYVKSELMRINRQISSFSKDNYLFEELKGIIGSIDSAIDLHREAIEINDDEIKKMALNDLNENKEKLEELQKEIIEYFIPDEYVKINLNSKT
jgi:hypothetical protein